MSRGTDVPPRSGSASEEIVRLLLAEKGRLLAFLERLRATCGACFEHGCPDCFCRTPQTLSPGDARPPPMNEGEV